MRYVGWSICYTDQNKQMWSEIYPTIEAAQKQAKILVDVYSNIEIVRLVYSNYEQI